MRGACLICFSLFLFFLRGGWRWWPYIQLDAFVGLFLFCLLHLGGTLFVLGWIDCSVHECVGIFVCFAVYKWRLNLLSLSMFLWWWCLIIQTTMLAVASWWTFSKWTCWWRLFFLAVYLVHGAHRALYPLSLLRITFPQVLQVRLSWRQFMHWVLCVERICRSIHASKIDWSSIPLANRWQMCLWSRVALQDAQTWTVSYSWRRRHESKIHGCYEAQLWLSGDVLEDFACLSKVIIVSCFWQVRPTVLELIEQHLIILVYSLVLLLSYCKVHWANDNRLWPFLLLDHGWGAAKELRSTLLELNRLHPVDQFLIVLAQHEVTC